MAVTQAYIKSDNEVLDYVVDWSNWLGADTISTSVWNAEVGITQDSETETTTTATIWLSGGTNNSTYLVTNQIVTVAGRTAERSFRITIEDR